MTAAPGSCIVRVLSRAGCGLCEEVLADLADLQERLPFEVTTLDIAGDAGLEALHGERIPVVEVNGREIGWGRIPPAVLERRIRLAAAGA